ncbi:MAG: hypothetical protein OXG39_04795 [Chloroflexi bacterium]|nr:hypothetical protein [Chloroflexota bacterium]
MNTGPRLSLHSPTARALPALIAVLLILLTLAIHNAPAPRIETEFGGATVDIRADRAWTLLPGDCVTIAWDLEGIHSLYVDGQGKIGWGEMAYCPSLISASPQFEVSSANGEERPLSLDVRYLPLELLRSLLLFVILALLLIAAYYLVTMRLGEPLPFNANIGLALLALLIACLLGQTGDAFRAKSIIAVLGKIFASHTWQLFGVAMAGVVYSPLLIRSLKAGRERKAAADFAAIAVFFVFPLLLYLPFGFDSIGHWEEWVINAYFEGRPSKFSFESLTRSWSSVPHALAHFITSESFAGYHLVSLFMLWGKLALFYGIMRKLRFAPLYAFLVALLYMAYPVNSMLLSLRSMPMHFSMFGLLAAFYLALDYQTRPSRLAMLGMWLGLLFNIGTNESGYALILSLPLLFWYHKRLPQRRNVSLTFNWFLFPASKAIFLLLLASHRIAFYGWDYLDTEESAQSLAQVAGRLLSDLAAVYETTFVSGWGDAIASLQQSAWFGWVALLLAPVILTAIYLQRASGAPRLPNARAGLALTIVALAGIALSVGVLIWFDRFSKDLWRLYFYLPIFAAITVFAIMVFLTARWGSVAQRHFLHIVLFLLLMIPATNRLLRQHERITNSADVKARVLLSMMEQAPAFDANAIAIMLTHRSVKDLMELEILEFESNMMDSAFHILWQDRGPRFAFFCARYRQCHPSDIDYYAYELNEESHFDEMVIFRIHDDLTVELLRELPPELGGEQNHSYKPDRLIDTSAPIPPRAVTMLTSARRD